MSKRYTHYRPDIADLAAMQALAAANPPAFPVGAEYVIAAGVRLVVTANDGVAPVIGTVTVVVV
jgi:hypothetical protein